jgi:hypothetical protein
MQLCAQILRTTSSPVAWAIKRPRQTLNIRSRRLMRPRDRTSRNGKRTESASNCPEYSLSAVLVVICGVYALPLMLVPAARRVPGSNVCHTFFLFCVLRTARGLHLVALAIAAKLALRAFVAAGSTVGGVPERVLFGEKGRGAKGVLMGRGQAGNKLGGHEGCQHSMAWLLLLTE